MPSYSDRFRSASPDDRKGLIRFIAGGGFCLVIIVIAVALLSVSIKRLESNEYGVKYHKLRKTLADAAEQGGLHIGPPGFEFIQFPSTYLTEEPMGTCLSRDGLRVNYQVTYQYQMPAEWMVPAINKYRDFMGWTRVVEAAGSSAIQHACSAFETNEFQKQRGVIQTRMEELLREKLEGTEEKEGVYAKAISLQLRNVELPTQYQNAVAEKQSAAEDIALATNQRTQETTKAETQLLAAGEEARKIQQTAEIEANLTKTEALLKAEEILFEYETEALILKGVKDSLNLTTDGLLGYMSNQLVQDTSSLHVTAGEPASFSRKGNL